MHCLLVGHSAGQLSGGIWGYLIPVWRRTCTRFDLLFHPPNLIWTSRNLLACGQATNRPVENPTKTHPPARLLPRTAAGEVGGVAGGSPHGGAARAGEAAGRGRGGLWIGSLIPSFIGVLCRHQLFGHGNQLMGSTGFFIGFMAHLRGEPVYFPQRMPLLWVGEPFCLG